MYFKFISEVLMPNHTYRNMNTCVLVAYILLLPKCDIIKGNESDVGNFDLSYRLKEMTDSYLLHCFCR